MLIPQLPTQFFLCHQTPDLWLEPHVALIRKVSFGLFWDGFLFQPDHLVNYDVSKVFFSIVETEEKAIRKITGGSRV